MPRFLLRGFTSHLRKLHQIASNNIQQSAPKSATPDPARFQIWGRFSSAFTSSPIAPLLLQGQSSVLDSYLRAIDGLVRSAYETASRNTATSASKATDTPAQIEREMFVSGDVPDVLGDAVMQGVLAKAAQLKEVVMPGLVYRAEIGWLGVTEEAVAGDSSGREVVIDVIRKWPIGNSSQPTKQQQQAQSNGGNAVGASGKKVKKCPRCRSVSEEMELGSSQREALGWLIQAMRQCVCTNSWVMHEEESSHGTNGVVRTGWKGN
jgi:hypothetical protein